MTEHITITLSRPQLELLIGVVDSENALPEPSSVVGRTSRLHLRNLALILDSKLSIMNHRAGINELRSGA